MPSLIADRYQLEIRLGREGDVEEWLGTDATLSRPVLVRILGPDTTKARRAEFLEAVRVAGRLSHVHLAEIYAAESATGSAYAVQEWSSGVTLDDRLRAGDTIPVEEFLPNAAGLASALAVLHEAGAVHGGPSPDAIEFSAAHPAKLSRFGSPRHAQTATDDTASLAATLSAAVTGSRDPLEGRWVAPSQVCAGLSAEVDIALEDAVAGRVDARGLAQALRSAPSVPAGAPQRAWSWRWTVPAIALLVLAAVVAGLGLILRVRPSDSPLLYPVVPVTTTTEPVNPAPPPSPTIGQPAEGGAILPFLVAPYDPFGDETERESDVSLLGDGDQSTGWRTERYFDPLRLIKSGVGLTFVVDGAPRRVEFTASADVAFELAWARNVPDGFADWEGTAAGLVVAGTNAIQLPPRAGGVWLLWFTDLPPQEGGEYFYAYVYEVRFIS